MVTENDNPGGGPKITPSMDEIASFQRGKGRGITARLGEVPHVESHGSSTTSKAILAFATIAVLVALSWSVILHKKLTAAEQSLRLYEQRINSLEKQLYVTDESMSESSVAMKSTIREMDTEIRKLWDNVWKKTKERMEAYDKKLAQHDTYIASSQKQLSDNDSVVKALSAQLEKTRRMQVTVTSNQQRIASQEAMLEANTDKINRLSTDMINMNRRVDESETWVDSINGFRRQVNRDIADLRKEVGGVTSAP